MLPKQRSALNNGLNYSQGKKMSDINEVVELNKKFKSLSAANILTGYIIDSEFLKKTKKGSYKVKASDSYHETDMFGKAQKHTTHTNTKVVYDQTWAVARISVKTPDDKVHVFVISSENKLQHSEIKIGQLITLVATSAKFIDESGKVDRLVETLIFHSPSGNEVFSNINTHSVNPLTMNTLIYFPLILTLPAAYIEEKPLFFKLFFSYNTIENYNLSQHIAYLFLLLPVGFVLNRFIQRAKARSVLKAFATTPTSNYLAYQRFISGVKTTTDENLVKESIKDDASEIIREVNKETSSIENATRNLVYEYSQENNVIDPSLVSVFKVSNRQVTDEVTLDDTLDVKFEGAKGHGVFGLGSSQTNERYIHHARLVKSSANLWVETELNPEVRELSLPEEAIKLCDVGDVIIVSLRNITEEEISLENAKESGVSLEYVHNVTKGRTFFSKTSVERQPLNMDIADGLKGISFIMTFVATLAFIALYFFVDPLPLEMTTLTGSDTATKAGISLLLASFIGIYWIIKTIQLYKFRKKILNKMIRANRKLYDLISASSIARSELTKPQEISN